MVREATAKNSQLKDRAKDDHRYIGPLLFAWALVISLLSCELMVRWLSFAPQVIPLVSSHYRTAYRPSSNPVLGYELTPNYRDDSAINHYGSFAYVNADGRRDREREVAKIVGRKRIIMLGDSVVAGHGVYDIADTISMNLEKLLGTVEVLNFGVGGYNTLSEAELLRVSGLKYLPDAVLLVCVDDDNHIVNWDLGYAFEGPAWFRYLFFGSDLFRLVSLSLNFYDVKRRIPSASEYLERERRGAMEMGFSALHGLSIKHGFRLGIVIWPRFTDETITDERFPRLSGNPGLLPEALAERFDLPVKNLKYTFETKWKEECQKHRICPSPRVMFTAAGDTLHPNPEAARIAAVGLKDFAEQLVR